MKEFIKYTLATITGLIVTGGICLFIGIIVVASLVAVASGPQETEVKDNSIMVLDLKGTIHEQIPEESPMSIIMGRKNSALGLKEILAAIDEAKHNPKIKGIYLRAGKLNAEPATLQEIRDALLDFKEEKFILAYSDNYTQGCYYLCSLANKVMLNPIGCIDWLGLSSETMYYKDLLDKVGVEFQVFKVGTYKAAVEPFLVSHMSDANREQITAHLQSVWGNMVDAVVKSRKISADSLNSYADRYIAMEEGAEFVKVGMADTLIYQNDVKEVLKSYVGVKEDDDLNLLSLTDMINIPVEEDNDAENGIAIYYAEGEIDGAASQGIDSREMSRTLRELADDDDIKAVVLRVNSPGGSSFGSEQIWNEVKRLKEKKPVIVSMGDYAASGGYYISCAATKIIAEPTTLTGSIGIFGMIPSVEKVMNEKLGLHVDVVKTNKFAASDSYYRSFNDEESAHIQRSVNQGYELFVSRCADGRGLSTDSIKSIAEGRVWTGETAQKLGLVDELGGIDTAIATAAVEAGIDDFYLVDYPEKEDMLDKFLNDGKDDYLKSMFRDNLPELYPCLDFLKNLDKKDKVQARLPFELNLNI